MTISNQATFVRIRLALAASLLAGCVGQEVRGRADAVGKIVKSARANGAYHCAPKELALAEAHLQRTRDELDLGNLIPARRHILVAHENARIAFKRSPPERCVPKVDSDGDGCPDNRDHCPNQPEDLDGFEDDDCCPDPDNDQDGIADAQDSCPNRPEDQDQFDDEDGCPEPDNDADTIVDQLDRCPNQPEDHDGYKDSDGCPDDDNDNDRIADKKDQCPNQPEDYDNDADEDGCPDAKKYKLIKVTKTKIELKQKIFFATGKTRILSRSFRLLNEVVLVLKDRKSIQIRIEGHTDSRGSKRYNQRLSHGRANSVRSYLIRRGIDPVRLEAIGYGEDRPIAENSSRSGRALNRRVEFFITKQ